MCIAKERDVDMVLLAGDLFHENKPSRKSMYQVMRSLRKNSLGEKPCELELLSDATESFDHSFNHVNYEDQDINVAIPVFSIHGNHDDPSGEGHFAALDLLQVSGLINFYGRTPESDNIQIKPVLLQKGRTKLALYGMSNVRDERLFRTFREGRVKFFRPSTRQGDWFSLMSVHQNHHAYNQNGYLPEEFLPEFMDLVVWGHEHECLIEPRLNPEMNFHVMQPGSSVATSLVPGEAVPKEIAILSITGRDFECETIPLKTVRPFAMKEIVLSEEKGAQRLARKDDNRTEITRFLMSMVDELIEKARTEWLEMQDDAANDEEVEIPLPLVRLRVETSIPGGGSFQCENPQRFSNRFVGKVANVNDVVQFYRKRKGTGTRLAGDTADVDEEAMSHLTALDNVKVDQLVREYLETQTLTVLPQNSFGDAVSQFIEKDDKHVMELFLNKSLDSQNQYLLSLDDENDEMDDEGERSSLQRAMERYRTQMEETFNQGGGREWHSRGKKRFNPRPDGWDSDFDGPWEDQPGALIRADDGEEDQNADEVDADGAEPLPRRTTGRDRGRGRGGRAGRGTTTARSGRTATTTTKGARATNRPSSTTTGGTKNRRQVVSEEEDDDVIMPDNDDDDDGDASVARQSILSDGNDEDDDSQALFFEQPRPARRTAVGANTIGRSSARSVASPAPSSATLARSQRAPRNKPTSRGKQTQTTLDFGSSQARSGAEGRSGRSTNTRVEDIVDDDDDDDDAFEAMPTTGRPRRR